MLTFTSDPSPSVDLERFPRENVHFPEPKDNPLGAWAWKCTVKDKSAKSGGLLEGKTIALKDCIALAGVPFLLGTDMIKDYVPVRFPHQLHESSQKLTKDCRRSMPWS